MNVINKIGIIIPAAGMGRRMKSYGPKPLIKIGSSTIIKNQIQLLQTYFSHTTMLFGLYSSKLILAVGTTSGIVSDSILLINSVSLFIIYNLYFLKIH